MVDRGFAYTSLQGGGAGGGVGAELNASKTRGIVDPWPKPNFLTRIYSFVAWKRTYTDLDRRGIQMAKVTVRLWAVSSLKNKRVLKISDTLD